MGGTSYEAPPIILLMTDIKTKWHISDIEMVCVFMLL